MWGLLCVPVGWAGVTSHPGRFGWWETAGAVVAVAGLVGVRVRWPLGAMVGAIVLWEVALFSRPEYPEVGGVPFLLTVIVLSYLAGVRMSSARPAVVGFVGVGGGVVLLIPLVPVVASGWFTGMVGVLLFGLVPWSVGRYRRDYLELERAGWERAELLERAQRLVAEQARMRERARLAGDMHDLVGHELGLAALRIGALELDAGLDERHRAAAGGARAAVTGAAERLVEVVELLREESAAETLDELVARNRASGLGVELRVSGDEPPQMVQRTVDRVVRESLTNAAKHAVGASVTVDIEHAAGEAVANGPGGKRAVAGETAGKEPDGRRAAVGETAGKGPGGRRTVAGETVVSIKNGPGVGRAVAGGGHGLTGMAERVRLVGGELRAGPDGDGFTVTARLPHEPGPVPREPEQSESEVRHEQARRRVRRSFTRSMTAAGLVVVGTAAVVLGYTVYDHATSVLRPADFERLRTGQPLTEVQAVLPGRTRVDTGPEDEPAVPAGANCRYYGTHLNPFDGARNELYRLCFVADRLAAKDFLG